MIFCKQYHIVLSAICLYVLCLSGAGAQIDPAPGLPEPADTVVKVFPLEALLEQVLENHPLVEQAGLLNEEAARQIMEARGVFDPKLVSDFDKKVFKDTHYFTTWKSELKIPLFINTDLKVGYENNSGYYLNDRNKVPEAGLLYAGITVPLGQGLLTDTRRTGFRAASLNTQIAEAERIKSLNKLLYETAKDYWNWSLAFYQLQVSQEGVILARFRYLAIKEGIEAGDAAPIDSVEAKITLQSREIELAQSGLDYRNALLALSQYLWNEEGDPLFPAEGIVPENLWEVADEPLQAFQELSDIARRQHPELRKLEVKRQQLELEERLYKELLKPVINLSYNYLSIPDNVLSELNYTLSQNYKLGAEFAFPLLLRKERAKLQLNRVKQQQNLLALNVNRREVDVAIRQAYNDFLILREILEEQQLVVNNYRRMLEGEVERFDAGESSLFLVNQRENKLLEAQIKLLSLAAKYRKARAAVLWSAGLSVSDLEGAPDQGSSR